MSRRLPLPSVIWRLDFGPQVRARVLRIQLRQLPQQFLRPLVARHGYGHSDLDNLIPAHAFFRRRRHTLLPQPQFLTRLRSRRNLQQRPPINRRHFNLRPQRRLGRAHRHSQIDVVPVAPENRMLLGPDNRVHVARRSAVRPGVALARKPNALPVPRPRLDPHLERFGFRDRPFAVAHGTRRQILSRPMASRTLHIELHPPAGLRDLPGPVALRTFPRRFERSLAVAGRTSIMPRNIQPHHPAADRRPERNVDLILEVGPRLRPFLSRRAATSAENPGKDVAETSPATPCATSSPSPAGAVDQIRKIESAEVERNPLTATRCSTAAGETTRKARGSTIAAARSRVSFRRCRIDVVGVEPDLIVDLSFLSIAKNVVGLGERLKLLLRRLVPRIDVRMVFPRQLAKRFADVVSRSRLLHAENLVVIFFGCGCHGSQSEIEILGSAGFSSESSASLYLLSPESKPQTPRRPHRPGPAARPSGSTQRLPTAAHSRPGSKNKSPHLPENPLGPPNA